MTSLAMPGKFLEEGGLNDFSLRRNEADISQPIK